MRKLSKTMRSNAKWLREMWCGDEPPEPDSSCALLEQGAARIEELEGALAKLASEHLDTVEEHIRQSCGAIRQRGMEASSAAFSTRADGLRELAAAGRFRITREHGRVVVGYWPEDDPEKPDDN